MTLPNGSTVQLGDTIMLVSPDQKTFVRTIREGHRLQIHKGLINFDDLVGVAYGEQIKTHTGTDMYLLAPTLEDIIQHMKRETQIIYPKDLAQIVMRLGIREGMRVVEAGTGSGALTSLLALMVGETGHVYTYERREKMQNRAVENLEVLGLAHRVTFYHHDINEGIFETDVNALFLDLPGTQYYLDTAHQALRGGGMFGAIVPTMNQLIDLLGAMHVGPWFFTSADEVLIRGWKTNPPRVRPEDNMVAHTGFLVFSRAVAATPEHLKQRYAAQTAIEHQQNLTEAGAISEAEDD